MIRKFYDARYPARDCREAIPHEEVVARVGYNLIVQPDPFWLDYMEVLARGAGPAPRPNRSARVEARRKSGMGEWVEVRGSAEWWGRVEDWLAQGEEG